MSNLPPQTVFLPTKALTTYFHPLWLQSYLNTNTIDWSGKIPLTRTGKFDYERAQRQGIAIHYSKAPIPVIAKDHEYYPALVEAVERIRNLLAPAISAEIGAELKRLSVWCPVGRKNFADIKSILTDALADLADLPLDLLQLACKRYRNSTDEQCNFFPRPGKLRILIQTELEDRRTELYKLEKLFAAAQQSSTLSPPPLLQDFITRATRQLETEAKLAQLLPTINTPSSTLMTCVKQCIERDVQGHHLTLAEAERLLSELYNNPL